MRASAFGHHEALSTRPMRTLISEAFPSSEIQPRPWGRPAHIPAVGGSRSAVADLATLRGARDDFSWRSSFWSKPSAEIADLRGTVRRDPCFPAS